MTTYDRTDDAFTPKGHPHRRQKDDDGDTVRLLWVGKIGCEKSTTGSTVLGQNVVHTAADSSSVTGECVRRVVQLGDTRFEIMVAPGLQDVHKTPEEICTIFTQSLIGMHPGPHAVLFFIEGARFDAKYHTAYKRLKALFDDSISRHTILVFTDVNELDGGQIMRSPENYIHQSVLEECEYRCLFINDKAADPQDEMKLLAEVRRLVARNRGRHYSCNKYSAIIENLEEEINKSQENFDKEDHGELDKIAEAPLAQTQFQAEVFKALQKYYTAITSHADYCQYFEHKKI